MDIKLIIFSFFKDLWKRDSFFEKIIGGLCGRFIEGRFLIDSLVRIYFFFYILSSWFVKFLILILFMCIDYFVGICL